MLSLVGIYESYQDVIIIRVLWVIPKMLSSVGIYESYQRCYHQSVSMSYTKDVIIGRPLWVISKMLSVGFYGLDANLKNEL